MKSAVASRLFFSKNDIAPFAKGSGGVLTQVTANEVPGFVHISYANLKLKKLGFMLPIWHPNAHKIGYCVQGGCTVSLRTPEKVETFSVSKGEMFFIPQGYVHQIENFGTDECEINFALNAAFPEFMSFARAIHSISDSVFNSTFKTPPGFVDGLKKSKTQELLLSVISSPKAPASSNSPYKFNIEKSEKSVLTKGGYLQLGIKKNFALLEGLGILGFGLNRGGSVEPHWHTNAGELVYIVTGKTKITVLAPDGTVDIMEVNAGEGAFAPASHFHNIENVGDEVVEVIAFFSDANPDYIGIGEVMGSYSNETLATIFNVSPDYFKQFQKPSGPLVIVPI